jgi:glutamate 5-kinase
MLWKLPEVSKGDIIRIKNENNEMIGIGKSQYSSEKATKELGSKNQQALVHYDYLYLID